MQRQMDLLCRAVLRSSISCGSVDTGELYPEALTWLCLCLRALPMFNGLPFALAAPHLLLSPFHTPSPGSAASLCVMGPQPLVSSWDSRKEELTLGSESCLMGTPPASGLASSSSLFRFPHPLIHFSWVHLLLENVTQGSESSCTLDTPSGSKVECSPTHLLPIMQASLPAPKLLSSLSPGPPTMN